MFNYTANQALYIISRFKMFEVLMDQNISIFVELNKFKNNIFTNAYV